MAAGIYPDSSEGITDSIGISGGAVGLDGFEFMEEELNQLHHEKLKNEMKAKEEFDNRVKETKRKAIEENIKKAEKTGNVLTQTLSEDGNLVGVQETVDFDSRDAVDKEDIKKHNEEVIGRALENRKVDEIEEIQEE